MQTPALGNAKSHTVDISKLIDETPISRLQWWAFGLTMVASLFDGFDTMVMSFLAPAITGEWHASHGGFGLVFSATLLGGGVGATVLGALADRFGRRRLIIISVGWFGLFTVACAAAKNLEMLVVLRLLAGFGLGGAIPNTLAIAAEYAPSRRRSTIVSIITWGTPLGAVLGGLISPPIVAAQGWRVVLLVAGVAPLLLLPFLLIFLPESVRYLAITHGAQGRLQKIMRQIAPAALNSGEVNLSLSERKVERGSIASLFHDGLAPGTILLSISMFTSLVLSFLLVNWAPTILKQAGIPLADAILGTVILNFSGIAGSLFIARMMDGHRFGALILGLSYLCAVAATVSTGIVAGYHEAPRWLLFFSLGACGFFLIGTQISLSAYITSFFPTAVRGTGIGFNNAVARGGSLLGPAAGGILLSTGMSPSHILTSGAFPGLISAGALMFLAWLQAHSTLPSPSRLTVKHRGLV